MNEMIRKENLQEYDTERLNTIASIVVRTILLYGSCSVRDHLKKQHGNDIKCNKIQNMKPNTCQNKQEGEKALYSDEDSPRCLTMSTKNE